ncbi:flagellar biosynthetic protein FliO [uncultured Treponema sp.]|uniref:FliO/MopB family protein n=1 Tax=uncultured Treponema sp. TaxID=162155 RepID=UPI0025D756ED|nr:flagellar biosynthetic protein FliO [uncultured Treponema sp.]
MTKFSRAFKALCFGSLVLFSNLTVFAQNLNQNQPESAQLSQNAQSESQNNIAQGQSSTQNAEWTWSNSFEQTQQAQPSTFALFLKMVFALALVLAIAYLALRLLKRGNKLSNSDDPFLRHVSHLPLSQNRSVDVVTILDHAFVLGVSDNAVNLISQIEDKELVNSMNLYADKKDNSKRPRSFDDILSIFMPGSSSEENTRNIYGSSAQDAADLLKRHRNRLNEEN